ncbi:hypothetical protein KSP39_PZI007091 [Platanthera zijinensis]|uniref:Reverse transcriptase domain-containing protein n=1 Tax=Platanthera zijinensis TaxID=2320716 RepID=A0AAP0G9R4_9ASPA
MVTVHNHIMKVLFNTGASHSFIASVAMKYLNIKPHQSYNDIKVTMPNNTERKTRFRCTLCLTIDNQPVEADVVVLPLSKFDIILGMDWLTRHETIINCKKKEIAFTFNNRTRCSFTGMSEVSKIMISSLKAMKKLRKGCEAILVMLKGSDTVKCEPTVVHVVCDFLDVFLEELPGLPPFREVEFTINLVEGATPVAKTPYRIAPKEMAELKSQLQELLDKDFIHPSTSLWGAPVLFVKRKDGSLRLCIANLIS